MLIPFYLLWNVRIRLAKKIAFLGIFSLSIVTMGIAIARATEVGATQKSNGLIDSTYLWFWSALQSSLCKSRSLCSCEPHFILLLTI
jgi:hypothetical protein